MNLGINIPIFVMVIGAALIFDFITIPGFMMFCFPGILCYFALIVVQKTLAALYKLTIDLLDDSEGSSEDVSDISENEYIPKTQDVEDEPQKYIPMHFSQEYMSVDQPQDAFEDEVQDVTITNDVTEGEPQKYIPMHFSQEYTSVDQPQDESQDVTLVVINDITEDETQKYIPMHVSRGYVYVDQPQGISEVEHQEDVPETEENYIGHEENVQSHSMEAEAMGYEVIYEHFSSDGNLITERVTSFSRGVVRHLDDEADVEIIPAYIARLEDAINTIVL